MSDTLKRTQYVRMVRKYALPITVALLLVVVMLSMLISIILTGSPFRRPLPKKGTSFVVLSVGQASCTLIVSDGTAILVDTGSNASEDTLRAALHYYGVKKLAAVFVSHADEDHAGGLDLLLWNFTVERVILHERTRAALMEREKDLLLWSDTASAELVSAESGDVFTFGKLSVEVLAPTLPPESIEDYAGNADSLVLLATYGDTTAIFPGDVDAAGEELLCEALEREGRTLSTDLLLAAHHGAATSSCEPFVSLVSPRYVVFSCGKDNSYGHPSSDVMHRFRKIGAVCFRTDTDGNVVFYSDGEALEPIP